MDIRQEKLVGARKRKPGFISKIPPSYLIPPHDEDDLRKEQESKSKLKLILSELKMKKMSQPIHRVKPLTPPTATPTFLPPPSVPFSKTLAHPLAHPQVSLQTEPLDLSMDAVDLSKRNHTPSFTPPPTNHMMQFYQQYFLNQTSTRDNMTTTEPNLATRVHPIDFVEVAMGEGLGCKSEKRMENVVKEKKIVCMALPRMRKEQFGSPDAQQKQPTQKKDSPQKPKQRRYRTERPFACPHCPARFTLRSNMERHGKHQHPSVWQRSPSNRVLNKQKLLSCQPKSPSTSDSSQDLTSVRAKLKRKLSENSENNDQLPSVDKLLRLVQGGGGRFFGQEERGGQEEREEGIEEGEVRDQEEGREHEEEDEEEELDEEEEEEEEFGDKKLFKKQSAYSSAPHKISCPHCSRRFPWTSSLRRHLLTHTGQKPFQCSKCPLLFTTKSNCDRHLIRKHGNHQQDTDSDSEEEEGLIEEQIGGSGSGCGEAMFRCHICDNNTDNNYTQSTSRGQVLAHMEKCHKDVYEEFKEKCLIEEGVVEELQGQQGSNRKVLCVFCLRRFWSVEDLRRHIRSHTGERPYSCKFCSRRFTLKHSMMRHQKKH